MSGNTTNAAASDFYDATMDKVLVVVYFVMALSVLTLNSLEVFLMYKLRNERSVTTVFTFSLTMTDIIMGSLGIPFSAISITNHRTWIFGSVICNITGFFVNTCIFTSLLSICLVTVNRYLALITPIKYNIYMTFPNSIFAVAVVWFAGFLRSSIPFFFGKGYIYYKSTLCNWSTSEIFGAENELPYFIVILVLPFCVTCLVILFCSVHMVIGLVKRSLHKRGSSKGAGDKERDAVITTFLIILAFILSYFCYYFTLFVYLYNKFEGWSDTQYLYLEVMMILMIYMNSLFNPLLYIVRSTKYRKELSQLKVRMLTKLKLLTCSNCMADSVHFTDTADLSTAMVQKSKVSMTRETDQF